MKQINYEKLDELLRVKFEDIPIARGGCAVFTAFFSPILSSFSIKHTIDIFTSASEDNIPLFRSLIERNASQEEVNSNGLYFAHLAICLPDGRYIDGEGIHKSRPACLLGWHYSIVKNIPLSYNRNIIKDEGNWNECFADQWSRNVTRVRQKCLETQKELDTEESFSYICKQLKSHEYGCR